MTIINKRLINYILIDKHLNEHFGQISIDFWSLEITEIKFEIRNQLEIKLISKSRTRFQQVSDPSEKRIPLRVLVASDATVASLVPTTLTYETENGSNDGPNKTKEQWSICELKAPRGPQQA